MTVMRMGKRILVVLETELGRYFIGSAVLAGW